MTFGNGLENAKKYQYNYNKVFYYFHERKYYIMAKTIITAALTGAITPHGYDVPETPEEILWAQIGKKYPDIANKYKKCFNEWIYRCDMTEIIPFWKA